MHGAQRSCYNVYSGAPKAGSTQATSPRSVPRHGAARLDDRAIPPASLLPPLPPPTAIKAANLPGSL